MSDVKRYDVTATYGRGHMVVAKRGEWVRHSDYAALEARLAEVEAVASLRRESLILTITRAERAEAALATARRDAWNRAAMVAEAWIARKENLISLPDTIRALAQEEPTT